MVKLRWMRVPPYLPVHLPAWRPIKIMHRLRNAAMRMPLDSRCPSGSHANAESAMLTILATMLVLLVLALPIWPYSRRWSLLPGCMIAVVIVLFMMFAMAGNIVA
jgi:fatty acid desaturase